MLCPALLLLAALPAKPAGHCDSNPETAWCQAKTIFICARSGFMREAELERAIIQKPEFAKTGLVITRTQKDADLVLEVRRKPFTSQFTISVIDRRRQLLLGSDRSNSIGGHIEPKLANDFVRMLRANR
ncbi:hypothetical protein [Paludibaculum fermentans]|uniref:Uncharacterized protein n=1 Tax=Paludibaculum fermentans TaxID=1473598 RepID=A0A7S7SKT7_PALFE|nr:hypothetical protein [Paludibaculum fermentans]QOY88058.1 hypothetical protein IRI77_35875 [Paludibaculum fermentans]